MRRLVTSRPGHGLVLAATFLIAGLPGVPGAGADGRQSVRRNPRSVRQCSALIEGGGMRPTRQGSGHPLAILLVGMSLYFAVVAITLAALGHDRQLAAAVAGSLVVFGAAVRLFGWNVPPASVAGVLTGWALAFVVRLARDRQTRA